MVPDLEGLTKQAQQRLDAIQQMEDNWQRAFTWPCTTWKFAVPVKCWVKTRAAICWKWAFSFYNEMLSEAVRCLKAGIEPDLLSPLNVSTEINLHAPALRPMTTAATFTWRLSFYKKLATAKNTDQIDALLEEIVDRFGKLPAQAQTLMDVHRLRVIAKPYGVVKLDAATGVITITFKKAAPIEPLRIIELIQKNPPHQAGWQ